MNGVVSSSTEEQPRKPSAIARMVGLERAAELLGKGGQGEVADALGISNRALRYKTDGRSGVGNGDLTMTAALLDRRARQLNEHARKLREEAGQ